MKLLHTWQFSKYKDGIGNGTFPAVGRMIENALLLCPDD